MIEELNLYAKAWNKVSGIEKAHRAKRWAFELIPGSFLLSHTVARAVPSAPKGLTSVFGQATVAGRIRRRFPEDRESKYLHSA